MWVPVVAAWVWLLVALGTILVEGYSIHALAAIGFAQAWLIAHYLKNE